MIERALSYEQLKWAHQKWCEGHSVRQIAKALFVCERTLARNFRYYGFNRVEIPLVYPGQHRGLKSD